LCSQRLQMAESIGALTLVPVLRSDHGARRRKQNKSSPIAGIHAVGS
jgi:hypothetical protein